MEDIVWFLKANLSTVRSFYDVPHVWYTFSDVKPTFYFNELEMLQCQ